VKTLSFFLPFAPGVKGNSKQIITLPNGKPGLVSSKEDKRREKKLREALAWYAPAEMLQGRLRLDVVFVLPIPPSYKGWRLEAAKVGALHPRQKDRGNLLKLIEDAMQGIFYADDADITDGPVSKRFGVEPGYQITLTELPTVSTRAEWLAWKEENPWSNSK